MGNSSIMRGTIFTINRLLNKDKVQKYNVKNSKDSESNSTNNNGSDHKFLCTFGKTLGDFYITRSLRILTLIRCLNSCNSNAPTAPETCEDIWDHVITDLHPAELEDSTLFYTPLLYTVFHHPLVDIHLVVVRKVDPRVDLQ